MMETKFTKGPWYVLDFRAEYMARLGWVGPAVDRILITNKTSKEIEACAGADSVIARIQFDNRPGQLGESNLSDAHLMAASPAMYEALEPFEVAMKEIEDAESECGIRTPDDMSVDMASAAGTSLTVGNLRAALAARAKARGESHPEQARPE